MYKKKEKKKSTLLPSINAPPPPPPPPNTHTHTHRGKMYTCDMFIRKKVYILKREDNLKKKKVIFKTKTVSGRNLNISRIKSYTYKQQGCAAKHGHTPHVN